MHPLAESTVEGAGRTWLEPRGYSAPQRLSLCLSPTYQAAAVPRQVGLTTLDQQVAEAAGVRVRGASSDEPMLQGPDIAAGKPRAERTNQNYRDVLRERRVRQALVSYPPDLLHEALQAASWKVKHVDAILMVACDGARARRAG